MPFIHVTSLPLDENVPLPSLVEDLTKDFARGTGIGLAHVTATWEFLQPGHYAVAGNVFINYRPSHAGMVFDAGAVVRW